MKRLPHHSVGALSTFYHFRRTMSSQAAHKVIREWVYQPRQLYTPNPMDMNARKHMEEWYSGRHYTGD